MAMKCDAMYITASLTHAGMLERIRFLQGGEAFPAHGAVGLQGQGDGMSAILFNTY